MRRYRVALAGYYGFGNLGDELLAEAAVSALLHCGLKRQEIVVFSGDPEDSRNRLGIDAVNRWNAAHLCKVLGCSDSLLLGGGGLFQDATSLRSCGYYWALVRLARFRGALPWALGQSIGPLSPSWGRRLARDALRCCRVLQVRDEASFSWAQAMGLSAKRGFDMVLSLGEAFSGKVSSEAGQARKLLVNLRPHSGNLPESLAEAIALHVRNYEGEVVGVALAEEDERLMRRLEKENRLSFASIRRISSLSDSVDIWRDAEAAIGMRLHFAVLSALAGVPLVAVPYDPKVAAFAAEAAVPIWRQGELPQPRIPLLPSEASSSKILEEIERLYRQYIEPKPE